MVKSPNPDRLHLNQQYHPAKRLFDRASRGSMALLLWGLLLPLPVPLMWAQSAPVAEITSANSQELGKLEPGTSNEREIAGSKVHNYQISAVAGQYGHFSVEQKGISLTVTLLAPDGKTVAKSYKVYPRVGSIPLSFIAPASGTYRLQIQAEEADAPGGRYTLKLEELRTATVIDKDRVTAETAFMKGQEVRSRQDTPEAQKEGIKQYEIALPIYSRLQDRQSEVDTLNAIGKAYSDLDPQKSFSYYERGLSLAKAAGYRVGEATLLNNIGLYYKYSSRPHQSLEALTQSLKIRQELGDRFGEGNSLNAIATIYFDLGDRQKALASYLEVLPLRRELGDRKGEALTLKNIAEVYNLLDEPQKALDISNELLPLAEKLGDEGVQAETLENTGLIYWYLGNLTKSLELLNRTLPLRQKLSSRIGEANTLNSLGLVYRSSGDLPKALESHEKALKILQSQKDVAGEGQTLSLIGSIYLELGKQQEAAGNKQQALNSRQQALNYYNRALPLAKTTKAQQAIILSRSGQVYSELNRKQLALNYYKQALSLVQEVRSRSREAFIRYGIAGVERDMGKFEEALAEIDKAIAIIEDVRTKISRSDLRASYFATVQDYYKLKIDVLMQLHEKNPSSGYDVKALEASEYGRARSLLELLTQSRVDIRSGVDPALLAKERNIKQQLSAKEAIRNFETNPTRVAELKQEIETLLNDYQEVQAEIKAKSPRYAALTQPQPLSLSQIQTKISDNTLLLEYSLGKDRSYLWAVTKNSIASYELPKGTEIEAAAKRFHQLASDRNAKPEELTKATHTLSQILLNPVSQQLGNKRLLVVGDGALQYVPFAALSLPGKSSPLILENEIFLLPSASTLLVLSQRVPGSPRPSKAVAAIADPVFSINDERVTKIQPNEGERLTASREALTRAAGESGVSFARLRHTRTEAEEILALVPSLDKKPGLDFAANRATVTSPELSQYQIVHFATHGILNSIHPELSGIVLSLVDDKGKPQDGFLRLHDIYNLNLPAELVVLSACQTGLGQEIKGEGLVGLTQGFMYAGTPRAVVSLWNVDDAATAELMGRFYRKMLKEGLQPTTALKAAQVEMSQQTQWKNPYYWAAFTLIGDGETPFEFRSNPLAIVWDWVALPLGVGAIALLIGGGSAIAIRKRWHQLPFSPSDREPATTAIAPESPSIWQKIPSQVTDDPLPWLAGGVILAAAFGASSAILMSEPQPQFAIYVNVDSGIELRYPAKWTHKTPSDSLGGTLVQFIAPPDSPTDTFEEKITLEVQDLSIKPLNLEQYSQLLSRDIQQHLLEANIISPVSDTTLANNPAKQTIYTGKDGSTRLQNWQIWTIKNNKAYIVTYESEVGKYSQNSQSVKVAIDSLEIN